jgi:hypothetical protein
MFDVFYSGIKPNVFAHEQQADSIEQAQGLSKTRYFWWVNYLSDYTDFDFSFEPKPWEAQYTHTWPSQHHEYSGTFLVPQTGKIEYKFHSDVISNREYLEHYIQADNLNFDFTWQPHPFDPPYIYVFGNQWYPANIMSTVEYHTPRATERKYMDKPRATLLEQHTDHWHTLVDCEFDYSWRPDPGDPPYIYVFGNQWWPATKMPTVEYHIIGATERKYMPYPRAQLLDNTAPWTVPDGIDMTTVDYSWVPDPGDPPYIYQFGTQHQRTGGPQYIVPGATEIKYVDQIKIKTSRVATAIYEIDHMDGNSGQIPNTTKTVRYFDNYLDTLKRMAKNIPHEYEFIWICSSVCDYTNFDFSWHPELWQAGMLHVFPSDNEKFGDTFFMHVPTFKYRAEKCQLLEWYDLNFTNISVPRRPMPIVVHTHDTHVEAIKTTDWSGPLAVFSTGTPADSFPTVPLWREKTKTVVPLSPGASTVIVPKSAVPYIKTQGYDYPYIDKTQKHFKDKPLDIVFIDNGEPNADDNFKYLKWAATRARQPNIHRSSGVNGRVAAYCAAAKLSTTPWFFAVFAKLEVDSRFDWSWQPDRLQEPKHYIFHALNPVNGLEYGHQAMIAYNKKLVLENTAPGLDFTLDQAHEVVPILSGTANYHYSKWVAWRTAFREVVKLKHSLPNVENEYRLAAWLDKISHEENHVENGEYSVYGAEDAVEYYDSVAGEFSELKKSYDWAWLASYAFIKRGLIPDQ